MRTLFTSFGFVKSRKLVLNHTFIHTCRRDHIKPTEEKIQATPNTHHSISRNDREKTRENQENWKKPMACSSWIRKFHAHLVNKTSLTLEMIIFRGKVGQKAWFLFEGGTITNEVSWTISAEQVLAFEESLVRRRFLDAADETTEHSLLLPARAQERSMFWRGTPL